MTFIAHAGRVEWALYDVPNGGEFNNGVAVVRHNGAYELMSKSGVIITSKQFKRINDDSLEFGYCVAENSAGEEGIINIQGDWIFPPAYKFDIRYDSYGVFEVKDKDTGKMAVFLNGHLVTPFKYDFMHILAYPFVTCKSDETEELINVKTEDLIHGSAADDGFYTYVRTQDIYGHKTYLYYDNKTGERLSSKELRTSRKNIGIDIIDDYNFQLVNTVSKAPISNAKYLNIGQVWINNRLICYDILASVNYVLDESGHNIFQVKSDGLLQNIGPYIYKDIFNNRYYDYNGNLINGASSLRHIDDCWYKIEMTDGTNYLYNAQKNKIYEINDIGSISDGMIEGSVAGKKCYFNTETETVIGPFNTTILNPFKEGIAIIDESRNEVRIIDKSGKELLNFRREYPSAFGFSIGRKSSEGVISFMTTSGDGCGYIYNPLFKERHYQQNSGGKRFTAELERKAREAFEKKRYAEAQAKFYQIFEIDRTKLWALSSYAACLNNQGFYDEAIETCEMVLAHEPDNEHALKLKKLAESNIKAMNSDDYEDEFETVANHKSIWNAVESIARTFMSLTGDNVPQSYSSFNVASSNYTQSALESNGSGNTNFQSEYDRWAQVAERHYNSLTNLGYSYTNQARHKKGNSGQGASPGKYTMMKRSLREAQREMRNIRRKARNAGVNIPQSQWETASVSY